MKLFISTTRVCRKESLRALQSPAGAPAIANAPAVPPPATVPPPGSVPAPPSGPPGGGPAADFNTFHEPARSRRNLGGCAGIRPVLASGGVDASIPIGVPIMTADIGFTPMTAGSGNRIIRGAKSTFHYGRWTLNPRYGWVWVPGYNWGPSWVCWRHSDGYLGWAPLPPEARV